LFDEGIILLESESADSFLLVPMKTSGMVSILISRFGGSTSGFVGGLKLFDDDDDDETLILVLTSENEVDEVLKNGEGPAEKLVLKKNMNKYNENDGKKKKSSGY